MAKENLKDKIEKLYKENDINSVDYQVSGVLIKNVEVLITNMIKQHYEWEEIKAIIGILKKGKWEDLINIVNNKIN